MLSVSSGYRPTLVDIYHPHEEVLVVKSVKTRPDMPGADLHGKTSYTGNQRKNSYL